MVFGLKAKLIVNVQEGRGLIAIDKSGTSDPYCKVIVGPLSKKTKETKKTLSPHWNALPDHAPLTFDLPTDIEITEVMFEIWDFNKISAFEKRMGMARVKIDTLLDGKEHDLWLTLERQKESDSVSGEIRVACKLEVDGSNARRGTQIFLPEQPLFIAIRQSDLKKVKELLSSGGADVNQKDRTGYTPLHAACVVFSDLDDEVLAEVLKHPDVDVNAVNEDQNTPLHYFCQKFRSPNCADAFQIFLEKGANVNATNRIGETPLHKAIFNSTLRILLCDLLLKGGADPNKQNSRKETPLHYAVRLSRADLVFLLLSFGASLDVKEEHGRTPYDLAVFEKKDAMAELLKDAQDVFCFLEDNFLEQYKLAFISHLKKRSEILNINDKTMDTIGVKIIGHRLKISKAVKEERKKLGIETPVLDTKKEKEAEKNSNVVTPVHSMEADLQKELEKLKELNKDKGTWILDSNELEFTYKLGTGTSGTVYKGLYKGKTVAIKVLKAESNEEMEEFKKEFRIMSAISSPYLVFFFGACLQPKMCMVMELCGRGSLYHVLKSPAVIGWTLVFDWIFQMVSGLDCLHAEQAVHRDFKSLNIMVNEQYQLKVGDFGLSRFTSSATAQATLNKMRGTFAYCAPEVYHGQTYTPKADVYSFSIVLWELLVRCLKGLYERPYEEYPNLKFDFQIIIQVAKKNLRPTIPKNTPECLKALCEKCWAPTPEPRPEPKEILKILHDSIRKEYNDHAKEWDPLIAEVQTQTQDEDEKDSNDSKDLSKLNGKASTNSTPSGSINA